ncbi:MAG TPA: methylated-DNA--[protein]-cysteine S-methyltransferase [Arachidicoccus sp.]|nr:methylated-DNA--[protein]-cysteine S-methyltransferase [Arachidicoccus sp.]
MEKMEVQTQTQQALNYDRIAAAIAYIQEHFREQPSLDEVAAAIHLSPAHFQRLFADWAGISPKKFLQYISLHHAKKMLTTDKNTTLSDAAYETGLSSTSRLHDLFITLEGMTPATYKNGGRDLSINYHFAGSPFGEILVASTPKGICYMAFLQAENEDQALTHLYARFPEATFTFKADAHQQNAVAIFQNDWHQLKAVKLHLKGTPFQLKVWETLLKIPMGQLTSYGTVAAEMGQPAASRAVGTAIGENPVAMLIPCHRVIQSTGTFGGYRWGSIRKAALIGWEAAKTAVRDQS